MIRLITLLVSGIPAIISGVIAFLARKLGTATASVAAFVVLTAAFIASINTALQAVLSAMQLPSWAANAVGMFIPANFAVVLGAVVAAKIARAAYDLALEKIKVISSAN